MVLRQQVKPEKPPKVEQTPAAEPNNLKSQQQTQNKASADTKPLKAIKPENEKTAKNKDNNSTKSKNKKSREEKKEEAVETKNKEDAKTEVTGMN